MIFLFSCCSFAMAEEGKARQGLQRTPTDYFSQIPIYSPSLMLFESPTRPASRESMLNTLAVESLERERHVPGTHAQPAQETGPWSLMSRCHQHSQKASPSLSRSCDRGRSSPLEAGRTRASPGSAEDERHRKAPSVAQLQRGEGRAGAE